MSMVCQIPLFQHILNHSTLNVIKSKVIREQVIQLNPPFMGNHRSALFQKEDPQDPNTSFLFTPIQSDIGLILICLGLKDHSLRPLSPLSLCCLLVGMTPACSIEMLKWPYRSCFFCSPHPNTHAAPHQGRPHGGGSVFSEQFMRSSLHCSSPTVLAVAHVSSSPLSIEPIFLMEGILCATYFPVLPFLKTTSIWV